MGYELAGSDSIPELLRQYDVATNAKRKQLLEDNPALAYAVESRSMEKLDREALAVFEEVLNADVEYTTRMTAAKALLSYNEGKRKRMEAQIEASGSARPQALPPGSM